MLPDGYVVSWSSVSSVQRLTTVCLGSPILPSSRGFKLANLNITSLVKRIDELRILLADTPVDVLSINETRLDDSV